MENELCRAIREHLIVECVYDDKHRVGEPHLVGVENNDTFLELFQTAGGSSRPDIPNWRHLKLDRISSLVVTDRTFKKRSDFNPHHRRWDHVVCSA